jgi:hypothetical protein
VRRLDSVGEVSQFCWLVTLNLLVSYMVGLLGSAGEVLRFLLGMLTFHLKVVW